MLQSPPKSLQLTSKRVDTSKQMTGSGGQILISMLVAIALFAILAQALFTLVSASFTTLSFIRARITARHLAQEKIEDIRNLAYDDIGTVGGIPSGPILQTDSVNRNGLNYTVSTAIVYIDDPFDGQAPVDLLPTDYKRARVDVSWEGLAASRRNPVTFITDIAPEGIESTTGGGTLSVLVIDANAQPVAQADVLIVANDPSPPVNVTLQTGTDGRVILPGAPPCTNNCYQITVTKEDYSTDRTYSTTEVANPDKPHLSVLEGDLTEVSFAIDKVGEIKFLSFTDREDGFNPLGNIEFTLRGGKTLGTDTDDELVYKYENTFTTDSDGEIEVDNLEWDNYSVFVSSSTGYDVSGTSPLLPVTLLPEAIVDFSFALSNDSDDSLLLSFTDPGSTQIASVSALLYDDVGYQATTSSGISGNPDFGQSFFSGLTTQIYHLVATASGYLDFTGDVSVGGYTTEQIILTPE